MLSAAKSRYLYRTVGRFDFAALNMTPFYFFLNLRTNLKATRFL